MSRTSRTTRSARTGTDRSTAGVVNAAALLVAVTLTACGSPRRDRPAPDEAEPPAATAPSDGPESTAPPPESPAPAAITLATIRARILEHADPRLAATARRIEEADALARQSGLWPNPYFKLRKVRLDHDGPFGSGFWEFELGQRFELAGKRGHREAEAAARADVARAQLDHAVRDAIRDAELGFFRLLRLEHERRVASRQAETEAERATLDAARADAGKLDRLVVLRSEARAERAALEVVELDRAHAAACRRMDEALGYAPGTVTRVDGAWRAAVVTTDDRERLQAQLDRHPRARTASRARAAADRSAARADADAWPDITPFLVLVRDDDLRKTFPGFGVNLALPVTSRNQGGRAAAAAARRRADKTLDAARRSLRVELDLSLVDHDAHTANVAAYDDRILPRLTRALEIAEAARSAGRASLVEVFDSRLALLRARRAVLHHREQLARAAVEIAYLTGPAE